jgi:hypothetical protein
MGDPQTPIDRQAIFAAGAAMGPPRFTAPRPDALWPQVRIASRVVLAGREAVTQRERKGRQHASGRAFVNSAHGVRNGSATLT